MPEPLCHREPDESQRTRRWPRPRHAAICVTTGLLHALSRDELAGALAHELGHVLRRSAVIKTTAAVLGAAVALLPPFGIFFGLGIGISLLLMFVTPPAAVLLQLAIARADEYAADEYGARLTGRPDVVAGLLGRSRSWTTRAPKIWRTAPWGERCSRSGDG